jgi:hypothetical protein
MKSHSSMIVPTTSGKKKKMRPFEIHLRAIGHWAAQLPEYEWTQGSPPQDNVDVWFAVKTRTGRILTGKTRAFRGSHLHWIAKQPKYGPVVAYVSIGD